MTSHSVEDFSLIGSPLQFRLYCTLHIGIGNKEYALGLGTWPGYPCDDFYDGNEIIKLKVLFTFL